MTVGTRALAQLSASAYFTKRMARTVAMTRLPRLTNRGSKALIQLSRQDLVARGMTLPIAAGMRVSADIRQG